MPFITELTNGFEQIGFAFIRDLGVWWFLAPIIILWFAMEVYLGEYKRETWGFSSSLATSISFTWINITSLRLIFLKQENFTDLLSDQLFSAGLFFVYGIFLMYLSFRHIFSEKTLATIAGPTPVYFLSVVSVLWGQGLLEISLYVIIDLVILYAIVWGIWKIIKIKYLGIRGEVEAIKRGEVPL